jgi:hypothetical protein
MGNLVFLMLTPLSHWSWFVAYVGSSIVRGLVVGLGVLLVSACGLPRWTLYLRRCGSWCLCRSGRGTDGSAWA